MIRRDVRLADGAAGWMLISQIEHARISGELAARCVERFGASPERAGASCSSTEAPPADVRDEILAAITRHDEGWAEWERAPRLDPALGRPLTFTEIEPAEAVAIWSASIAAAAGVGPLAAWMVAGHFLRLARKSDAAQADSQLATWRDGVERRRDEWLAVWRRPDPESRTAALADAALQWLWTFDEASLWFCCTCAPADHAIPCAPEPYCAGWGTPLEMELCAAGPEVALADPWRFAPADVAISATGRVVPARRYASPAELLAAAAPSFLRWRLTPGPKRGETPAQTRS